MRLRMILLASLLPAALPAHAGEETSAHGALGWSFEPWIVASLAIAVALYVAGLLRMRRRPRLRRVIGPPQIAAFAGGMLLLVLALLSPLDALGEELFSMHMLQHILLLLLAPPLLVASRPAIVFLWAPARQRRKQIGRLWIRLGLGRGVQSLMHPVLVWLLFGAAFALWHLPGPYQAALRNEELHALEHLSFFITALLFWTIVIEPSGRRRLDYGATLLFVATMGVFSGLPGALLFLAQRPLYPIHASGAAQWGMSLIEDQRVAGLIMWIPASFIYLAAVSWVFLRWLAEAERVASLRLRRAPPLAAPLALVLALALPSMAQAQSLWASTEPPRIGGDADRGALLIRDYGCGACHMVPGIAGADGVVGPSLMTVGRRIYLAGVLRNTPDNMMRWLRYPQQVLPGNAMPDMGLSAQDARDVASYLYTLQ
jgi:putative membrane protein